jgi:hypothetical protein
MPLIFPMISSHDYEQKPKPSKHTKSHIQAISVPSDSQKKLPEIKRLKVEKGRRQHKVSPGRQKKKRPTRKKAKEKERTPLIQPKTLSLGILEVRNSQPTRQFTRNPLKATQETRR